MSVVEKHVIVPDERELFDALLAYIERGRQNTHRRLEELARQRTALAPSERSSARESLRAQAAEISGDLIRLKLAASLARVLASRPHSQSPRQARLVRAHPPRLLQGR